MKGGVPGQCTQKMVADWEKVKDIYKLYFLE